MLFLSAASWAIGFVRLILVIYGAIWGIFVIYQGRKTNTKLLTLWGIYTIMTFSTYLGGAVDFLTILITDYNVDGYLHIFLSYPMIGFNGLLLIFILSKLLAPNIRWYFVLWGIVRVTIYELCLFLNPSGNMILLFPSIPGEEIIISIPAGPASYFLMGSLTSASLLVGPAFIYKGTQSQGIIRKKYFYLAIYMILGHLLPLIYVFISIPLIIQAMLSIIQLGAPLFGYLGIRKEPEKRKKKIKEEVKVKDSLFRVTQRPDQITDEEVTYYREQKICLICKGKVAGFNTYICPSCEALYHEECARTLSDLENACWVCNQPIDETKPTKPFKIVEERPVGEILAKEDKISKEGNKNSHKEC
jgi:hypothetical protein